MRKVLLVLLLVIGLAFLALYASLNELTRRGVERAATYATGVEASLRSARVALVAGEADLGRLTLANPQGYAAPFFLQVEAFHAAVNLRSLLNDVVRIPEVSLDGATLELEGRGTSTNFGEILRHMKRIGGGARPAEGEERRFIVDRLAIRNVHVRAAYGPTPAAGVTLAPVMLRDIGAKSGGVTLSELATLVVRALLSEARKSVSLPAGLREQLDARLGELGRLRQQVPGDVEGVQRRAEELFEREKKRLFGE